MFVRCKRRFKDGKEHRHWSVVENVRVGGGRVVQRQVLCPGEINDSRRAAWCRSTDVVEGKSGSRQMVLFPEDREALALTCIAIKPAYSAPSLPEARVVSLVPSPSGQRRAQSRNARPATRDKFPPP